MTMATTTIRIDFATLPDHLDRSRPSVVAEVIEAALRARAHGAASDQLQVGQHGAGGGQLCGRQANLQVREQVRAIGPDPALAQRGFNDLGRHAGAAAVEMRGQRGEVDADGGGGHSNNSSLPQR